MKKLTILFLVILLLAPIIVGASSDTLTLNQHGKLSFEQIGGLAGYFNRQFLWTVFCTLFFLILFCSAIVGLWKVCDTKNFKLKMFIAFQMIILAVLTASTTIQAVKHYNNKRTVQGGVGVHFNQGKLEKYSVKSGRYNESKKYIYKSNGEKYTVWPVDLLNGIANNELVGFFYIELMDTGTLKLEARQKMIINSQKYYGE